MEGNEAKAMPITNAYTRLWLEMRDGNQTNDSWWPSSQLQ